MPNPPERPCLRLSSGAPSPAFGNRRHSRQGFLPGAPHSKLHKLFAPGDEIDGDIAGMLAAFNRIDLVVEVPGYGKGGLSLVIP